MSTDADLVALLLKPQSDGRGRAKTRELAAARIVELEVENDQMTNMCDEYEARARQAEAKLQAVREWRISWLGTKSMAGKSLDATLDGTEADA